MSECVVYLHGLVHLLPHPRHRKEEVRTDLPQSHRVPSLHQTHPNIKTPCLVLVCVTCPDLHESVDEGPLECVRLSEVHTPTTPDGQTHVHNLHTHHNTISHSHSLHVSCSRCEGDLCSDVREWEVRDDGVCLPPIGEEALDRSPRPHEVVVTYHHRLGGTGRAFHHHHSIHKQSETTDGTTPAMLSMCLCVNVYVWCVWWYLRCR